MFGRMLPNYECSSFPSHEEHVGKFFAPTKRVAISYIREKRFLFKFFYETNLPRVIEGVPWTFNNHLLVFHHLLEGEDPLQVPLFSMDFWIQIHDLPNGLFNETMAKQFGGFLVRGLTNGFDRWEEEAKVGCNEDQKCGP
ncbi:hypothetical protein J1N35_018973 [Gossypium stocksii]|uniref:DUF4283 domain-containing protein n=1 Tax=Gossypium stocksii TaxID=47602 RepID=A0A9D3VQ10_9ROSI|nr:hypothetical protein J1N35_018973 [Gossypium stocksii]